MLRNVLAIVGGTMAGSVTNIMLITLGSYLITAHKGVDVSDIESIKASMHLYDARHFIFPFLAHAFGTLTGALAASLIAISWKMVPVFVVGGFFLLGGILGASMLPARLWFIAADLIIAYLPMSWIGWKLSGRG